MKILFISPLGFAIRPDTKYAGIERLVWEFSRELSKEHDVSVIGHPDSLFPEGVELLSVRQDRQYDPELKSYQAHQFLLRNFDVIHDFSHFHLASRFNYNLPSLNIFWHAPALAKYPKAPYNIIALSKWAAREFKRIYRQEARFQQSIVIDPNVYHPDGKRGDRFLTIGRMSPEKGNLNAVMLCRDAGVCLDVAGGRGSEVSADAPLSDYEKSIQSLCDGEKIRFLGEVTDEQKIELMQKCRGLVYVTDHPEVTSHKIQEAMFTGAPVIAPRIGAMPEIVTEGIDGFLCTTDEEYLSAVKNIDKLNPWATRKELLNKFAIKEVCAQNVELYKEVAGGLKW